MLHVSSWYDIFLEGALNAFAGISEKGGNRLARENQKLLVGPWAHLLPYNKPTSGDTGEIDFGDEARIELHDYLLRWFDHWLKDSDTGIMDEPPVRLFVMGENRWRSENEWPLARTEYTRFYLHSDGNANTRHGSGSLSVGPPGDEPPDSYVLRPKRPRANAAGQHPDHSLRGRGPAGSGRTSGCAGLHVRCAGRGPGNNRSDKRPSVRRIGCDGYGFHRQAGGCEARRLRPEPPGRNDRARFRDSASEPSPIVPGRIYAYEIDLWATSHLVRAGHRLRIEISSSNFPRFDRNPNTGAPFGQDDRLSPPDRKSIIRRLARRMSFCR